jgi:hypothetical protein
MTASETTHAEANNSGPTGEMPRRSDREAQITNIIEAAGGSITMSGLRDSMECSEAVLRGTLDELYERHEISIATGWDAVRISLSTTAPAGGDA